MRLESIEQIVNGIKAFMPSGIEAILSMDENGNIVVEYQDEIVGNTDVYSQDEFGKVIKDGVEILFDPSQMVMEDKKKEYLGILQKIGKTSKNVELRQQAITLMDNLGLGKEDEKEIEKVIKEYDKELKKDESLNEISDELANKVNLERRKNVVKTTKEKNDSMDKFLHQEENISNVVDKTEKQKEAATKLDKNIKLMKTHKNRKNESISEIEKVAPMDMLDMVEETFDPELTLETTIQNKREKVRVSVFYTSNDQNALLHTLKLEYLNEVTDDVIDEVIEEDLTLDEILERLNEILDGSLYEACKKSKKNKRKEKMESIKLISNNLNDLLSIVNEEKSKVKLTDFDDLTKLDEDDEDMLTDINDLDFPNALADTVETTEEGEVLTLGNAVEEIKDQITDLKDEIKTDIQDIKDQVQAELSAEDLRDLEDVDFESEPEDGEDEEPEIDNQIEIEDEILDAEEDEEEDEEDTKQDEENEENEENEEGMEESFKKYIKKGKLENLQKTKQKIDDLNRQGKDAEEIKDTIVLMSDDEKEEQQAKEYAIEKIKESLNASKYTCKLKNL